MDVVNEKKPAVTGNREVEKYIKFFALKSLQCVVQSRLGLKEKTKCNPKAMGLDWFNLSLENSDANNILQNNIRETMGKKIPGLLQPVCLDIILKTSDAKYTVLEAWQISTDPETNEPKSKNHFSVYNRLGVLLKSVISTARILPGYYLSRKVETDFDLFFKLHTEIYSQHSYELHNSMNIGSVASPAGKISISVLYRNKIWLSGSFHAETYVFNDTSKLFPLSTCKSKRNLSFETFTVVENEIEQAAADIENNITEEQNDNLLRLKTKDTRNIENTNSGTDHAIYNAAFGDTINFGLPDLDLPELSESLPFLSLMKETTTKQKSTEAENSVKLQQLKTEKKESVQMALTKEVPKQAEAVGFEDDFVLVELRPAFFSDDDSVGNLYKQCQHPPALDIFASLEIEDNDSEAISVDQQIEKYKSELEQYQDFFKSCLETEKV